MWAHVESADYSKACAGVAVSDSPVGPFKTFTPTNGKSPHFDRLVRVDVYKRQVQSHAVEQEVNAVNQIVSDRMLVESFLIHEDIIISLSLIHI